jgi:hypothetical protein
VRKSQRKEKEKSGGVCGQTPINNKAGTAGAPLSPARAPVMFAIIPRVTRVSIQWEDDRWYDGVVTEEACDGEHLVLFDDGDQAWYSLEDQFSAQQLRVLSPEGRERDEELLKTPRECGTPGCTYPDFHDGPCSITLRCAPQLARVAIRWWPLRRMGSKLTMRRTRMK